MNVGQDKDSGGEVGEEEGKETWGKRRKRWMGWEKEGRKQELEGKGNGRGREGKKKVRVGEREEERLTALQPFLTHFSPSDLPQHTLS